MDLLTQLVDLEVRLDRNNTLDYDFQKIPCKLDEEVRSLTDWFVSGTDSERDLITSAFDEDHSMTFIIFSERMAALGVRESSRKLLFAGLIAQVIEGWRFDDRDNLLRLSLIYHSAVKIGVDPAELFREASKLASREVAGYLEAFALRRPEIRTIAAMGYKESSDADGFRYERIR